MTPSSGMFPPGLRSGPGRLLERHAGADRPQLFELIDSEGQVHCVPFHRVREVYRNSERIWHRAGSSR